MPFRPFALGLRPCALLLLYIALSSASGCRGDGGEKVAPPPPIEECAHYEAAYRACGHKLGPVGDRLLAEHADRMHASLIPATGAPEGAVAETRRACVEAERRVTQACR